MRSTLKEKYGHEENLSRALGEGREFSNLLADYEISITHAPAYEVHVQRGHDNQSGRIDVLLSTNKGTVIVEVQYGYSDSSHSKRLQNYASNFSSTTLIVWVAEQFSDKAIKQFELAKIPVLCVEASLNNQELILKPVSAKKHVLGSQRKRIKANKNRLLQLRRKYQQPLRICEPSQGEAGLY